MYELIIPYNVGVSTQPQIPDNWKPPGEYPNQKVWLPPQIKGGSRSNIAAKPHVLMH